jgi:subtilisin family serine protease
VQRLVFLLSLILIGSAGAYYLIGDKILPLSEERADADRLDPSRPDGARLHLEKSSSESSSSISEEDGSNEEIFGTARIRGHPEGAIPGDYILHAKNKGDLAHLIEAARRLGLEVVGTSDALGAVRLRGDAELIERLLMEIGDRAELHRNYYTRVPKQLSLESLGRYLSFRQGLHSWLGIKGNRQDFGKGVTIAILDTGIAPHAVFGGRLIKHIDLMGFDDPEPLHGHGTAVASLIAGDSDFVKGLAPGATLLDLKVLSNTGQGDSFVLGQGIIRAVDEGARIITMSLGTANDSQFLRAAVEYALERGVTLVAAVGNEGVDHIAYPAAYSGVIAVGAVDAGGNYLTFSNRGDQLTVAAPGYQVPAAWTDGGYIGFTGTSAAAPLVAAAIGSLYAAEPSLTPEQAHAILTSNSNDKGPAGHDPYYGSGILDVERMETRNVPGIMDVAVADNYLVEPDVQGGTPLLIVTVQNRGTTDLYNVNLVVVMGQASQSFVFPYIARGATVSQSLPLMRFSEIYQVTSTASLSSGVDRDPTDNSLTTRVRFVN